MTPLIHPFIFLTDQNFLGTDYVQATGCQEAYKDEKFGMNPKGIILSFFFAYYIKTISKSKTLLIPYFAIENICELNC